MPHPDGQPSALLHNSRSPDLHPQRLLEPSPDRDRDRPRPRPLLALRKPTLELREVDGKTLDLDKGIGELDEEEAVKPGRPRN